MKLIGLLFPLLTFGLVACEDGMRQPSRSYEVAFKADELERQLTVAAPSEIRVVLPAPAPSSGYEWFIVANNGSILKQVKSVEFSALSQPSDPAGVAKVSFYTIDFGRSIVQFALLPSAAPDAIPKERHTLVVKVTE